jgi:hypothetical protein
MGTAGGADGLKKEGISELRRKAIRVTDRRLNPRPFRE